MICQRCGLRPGTETWVGDGGVLGFVHGMAQQWCKHCVLTAQIAHAREMTAQLPALERELEILKDEQAPG